MGARASVCAPVRACPWACVCACALVRVRARVECVRVEWVRVCVRVCVCVRSCRRVCVLTPPPNHPHATSRVACCTGHGPLQPLVARCHLARRRVLWFCLLPRRSGALRTALPQWLRRCGHAVRCEYSTRHGGSGFSGAIAASTPARASAARGWVRRTAPQCGRTAGRRCAPPGARWYPEYSHGYSEYSQ